MSRLQKDKINEIRSFLLLEQDKEINQIINTSHTRINGITSKEFMEKNKIEYEISINNGIIYDCYKLPKYGVDGDFGNETLEAVKQFQKDWGLTADGVVGEKTWAMLESSPEKQKLYTVTIPHLSKEQAEELLKKYK